MKQLLVLALALVMTLSLTACGGNDLQEVTREVEKTTGEAATADDVENEREQPEALTGGEDASSNAPESLPAESASAEANEMDQPQTYEAWIPLMGYWHAADGRFFLLDMADSHSAWFEEGIWDTGYVREGAVTQLSLTGETVYQGVVHYDAVEATEMDDAREAKDVSLTVDWTDREQDGKIRIMLGGEMFQCAYAGATREEAYRVHLENING